MQSKALRRFRRNRIYILGALIVAVSLAFVLVQQELKLQELSLECSQVAYERNALQGDVEALRAEVEQLDTDASKEALARDKLNMIKKDEILYIVKAKQDE